MSATANPSANVIFTYDAPPTGTHGSPRRRLEATQTEEAAARAREARRAKAKAAKRARKLQRRRSR